MKTANHWDPLGGGGAPALSYDQEAQEADKSCCVGGEPTLWDLHAVGGWDWQRAERIRNLPTKAARRRAIFELLTSMAGERLGSFTRELIAEYFNHGRPKKPTDGTAGVLYFILSGAESLRGRAREAAIKAACDAAGCSREDFRKHAYLIDSEEFRSSFTRMPPGIVRDPHAENPPPFSAY